MNKEEKDRVNELSMLVEKGIGSNFYCNEFGKVVRKLDRQQAWHNEYLRKKFFWQRTNDL